MSRRSMTRLGIRILHYFVVVKGDRAYHYCQSRDEALAFRVEMGEEI